jgi:anti-sigma regulatory factor (Ser/Thr protein kinase)
LESVWIGALTLYPRRIAGYRHQALLYEGIDGFMDGALPFLQEGLEAGDAMLVAVGPDRIARLRAALGEAAGRIAFVDMHELGRNPGRIIPAWEDFLADPRHAGRAFRGIGEPIWAGRSEAELVECQLHESLLNVAFADAEDFTLLCPYDVAALDPAVVHEARCSHPEAVEAHEHTSSHEYRGAEDLLSPFDVPLPPPPSAAAVLGFDRRSLQLVRSTTAGLGEEAGLEAERTEDLVLAVNEMATNSLRHGGGRGVLRMWRDAGSLVCEVRDGGRIEDPLVGRRVPRPGQVGGWGVWTAHQISDLVQLRSGHDGTVVRIHMHLN